MPYVHGQHWHAVGSGCLAHPAGLETAPRCRPHTATQAGGECTSTCPASQCDSPQASCVLHRASCIVCALTTGCIVCACSAPRAVLIRRRDGLAARRVGLGARAESWDDVARHSTQAVPRVYTWPITVRGSSTEVARRTSRLTQRDCDSFPPSACRGGVTGLERSCYMEGREWSPRRCVSRSSAIVPV